MPPPRPDPRPHAPRRHRLGFQQSNLKNYYKPDYFLENAETKAFFGGKLAERLGLAEFDVEQFHRLCDGLHPATGKKLTLGRKTGSRAGWDVTVDGPKDLGVLLALGVDDRIVPEVLERAARDVASEIERDAKTRVRVGKADTDRTTGNIAYTGILHLTSRPVGDKVDIQPHIHLLIHNATFDPVEKKMKALQLQPFAANGTKSDRPYYTAFLNARLAQYMQELGYELALDKKSGSFHVVGIPDRVLQEFSQRTNKIEAVAKLLEEQKQKFLGDPSAKLSPEVKGRLGAHTRERKQPGKTWDSLVRHWESRLQPGELQAINATVRDAMQGPMVVEDRSKESVDWALRHLLERKSVVSQRAVVTEALKHGLGFVTPENIYRELAERRDLIRRDVKGVEMVSTQGVLAEENRIAEFATKGKGRYRPLGAEGGYRAHSLGLEDRNASINTSPAQADPATPVGFGQSKNETRGLSVAPGMPSHAATPRAFGQAVDWNTSSAGLKHLAGAIVTLSPSQQAAVRHVWTSRDRLMLIRGAAGTGKTTLTKVALAGVNVPWVILAPSAEASRGVLRRDGFEEADTLAKFLTDAKMQEKVRNGLIWLDEASLAGAHDVAKLTQLADSLNARVVLSGDRRQHKSVSRGDVLGLLEDAGVPVAEVSEIRRQAGEYKRAVESLSRGEVVAGFQRLDRLGWVKESEVGLNDMIAEDYLAAVRDGKSVLVVSPTHAEGEKVTAAIRERLKAEGKLGGQEQRVGTLENLNLTEAQKGDPEALRQAAGAEAVFHKNSPLARAGARVTITAENAEQLADHADRFAVFAHRELALAAGDTVRITANGKTLDGEHRLNNGAVYRIDSFTAAGNIRLDNGWIIGKDNSHLAHGYVVTSHAAQGRTVDRVLIAQSAESFPASGKEQFYVSVSRGRERATVYTNDKEALRESIGKEDARMLATDLVRRPRRGIRSRLKSHLAWLRGVVQMSREQMLVANREMEVSRDRG